MISAQVHLLRFSQTRELLSSKAAFTIAFFAAVNHNYNNHKQRTLKHRKSQKGSKSTDRRSQTMTFWTRISKVLFPKRSAKIIGRSEKSKRQLVLNVKVRMFLKSAARLSWMKGYSGTPPWGHLFITATFLAARWDDHTDFFIVSSRSYGHPLIGPHFFGPLVTVLTGIYCDWKLCFGAYL